MIRKYHNHKLQTQHFQLFDAVLIAPKVKFTTDYKIKHNLVDSTPKSLHASRLSNKDGAINNGKNISKKRFETKLTR